MASSAGRQPRRLKAAHKEGSVGARADAIAEMQKMARSPRGRALLRYNKAGWGQKRVPRLAARCVSGVLSRAVVWRQELAVVLAFFWCGGF